MSSNEEMRLNKWIAHGSRYSRREADRLIAEGRVCIDGVVVSDMGRMVQPGQKVTVDDRPVQIQHDQYTVIVYHKPKGELVTKSDPRERKTIYHDLPGKFRHFIPVGRLDYASEGVLLMTDAPWIADTLMHSSLPRTYNVKIDGEMTEKIMEAARSGLILEDATKGAHEKTRVTRMEIAPFLALEVLKNSRNYTRLRLTLGEGKNREIRRFFAHFGRNVLDLKRVAFGPFELNMLPVGKTRYLSKGEYAKLRELISTLRKDDLHGDTHR